MSLSRRLDAIEKRLKPADDELQGTIEIHYTEPCRQQMTRTAANLQQCQEHPSSCAVSISRTYGALQREYIFRGPWLGIG